MKCSICGKEFEGWGNNAWPVNDGTCCDECNANVVIPMRLADLRAQNVISQLDFDTAEEGIEQLRSIHSTHQISESMYNYILEHWDRLIGASK